MLARIHNTTACNNTSSCSTEILCHVASRKSATCSEVVSRTCFKEVSSAGIRLLQKLVRKTVSSPAMSPFTTFIIQNGLLWEPGYSNLPPSSAHELASYR